ncbi:hypothetical protein ACFSKL_08705 [Belliella marina]|uniref:Uncharacterized protein n=1 Tax=Belliella marina TaxID=1644146 RepID=A0ABW4VKJ9_9BACT
MKNIYKFQFEISLYVRNDQQVASLLKAFGRGLPRRIAGRSLYMDQGIYEDCK